MLSVVVLDRKREVGVAVAGARAVGPGSDLGAAERNVIAVDTEVPGRLRFPFERATGVLALVPEVERHSRSRDSETGKSPYRLDVPAPVERGHAVEHQIVRNPVAVEPRAEDVVDSAADVEVHVVAAEVLAVAVDPALAVAADEAEVRQHAVVQVLVLHELGQVLAAGVGDDAADGGLTGRDERLLGGLRESRHRDQQGGVKRMQVAASHGCHRFNG